MNIVSLGVIVVVVVTGVGSTTPNFFLTPPTSSTGVHILAPDVLVVVSSFDRLEVKLSKELLVGILLGRLVVIEEVLNGSKILFAEEPLLPRLDVLNNRLVLRRNELLLPEELLVHWREVLTGKAVVVAERSSVSRREVLSARLVVRTEEPLDVDVDVLKDDVPGGTTATLDDVIRVMRKALESLVDAVNIEGIDTELELVWRVKEEALIGLMKEPKEEDKVILLGTCSIPGHTDTICC